MPSNTYSPSLDQGAKLTFESNFLMLAQQKATKLGGSGICVYVPSMGKTHNMVRMGSTELTKVNTRNPLKQYADYNIDNRQFSKARFTKTFQIDKKQDINELIADPTSNLLQTLVMASKRTMDREIILGATGAVLVGAPDETPTSLSAANDGVISITATGGLDYSDIVSVTQNFINNDIPMEDFRGSIIALTGKENSDLMGITEFINNDFISGEIVNQGVASRAGMYGVIPFAGSVTGGITVPNPILVEGVTNRSCVVLAPNSVAISYELADLRVENSAERVNSVDITIDMWIGTMRIEGPRVQILTTTI